ncbi:hypothetical protein [Curtobacterium sp. MCBA15_001]|uniref:hypothetical protein n=1 Tax=Curtobacterium sp. MCBA15_001 TaxID=1898731 RepID=UPI0008DCA242|nr:hypothetical protein [Curtobacterium sp. MCBA15_001]OIH95492.1 hypothetical protein BIU90_01975 [Curtobacterium sp. MCBA15_001]
MAALVFVRRLLRPCLTLRIPLPVSAVLVMLSAAISSGHGGPVSVVQRVVGGVVLWAAIVLAGTAARLRAQRSKSED